MLEQNKRRSRMKLAVFCVLAVSVCGLTAMLIQGCKREQSTENMPPMDTNNFETETSPPPLEVSNPPVAPPVSSNLSVAPPVVPPVTPQPPENTETEYVVVKGDTLSGIAKTHGVTLKALEAANPDVQPTKLQVGQKLNIPAGGTTAMSETMTTSGEAGGEEIYVVKSGDTLTKIARTHGTTVKALEAANRNVDPQHIKVGQKLKLPAAATAPALAPSTASEPPPATAPVAPGTATAPDGQ